MQSSVVKHLAFAVVVAAMVYGIRTMSGCGQAPAPRRPEVAHGAGAQVDSKVAPVDPVVAPEPPDLPVPDAPRRAFVLDGAAPYEQVYLGYAPDHALYVAGTYRDELKIGTRRIVPRDRPTWHHWFLARIEPGGELGWLRNIGGNAPGEVGGLAVAPDGGVVLIGDHVDGVGKHSEKEAAVIAAFAPDGTPRWEHRITGPGRHLLAAIQIDQDGSVVVCGGFEGATDFGGRTLESVAGRYTASVDMFVARLTASGALAWVAGGGGAEDDRAMTLAIAPGGDVVVGGEIGRMATFGGTVLRGPGASQIANPSRMFVARYAVDGALRWASEHGDADLVTPEAIAAREDGTLVVYGQAETVEPAVRRDGFVVTVDARGRIGDDRAAAHGVAVAADGRVTTAHALGDGLRVERHGAARTASEAAPMLPKLPFVGLGLARDRDGRLALAAQLGKETEHELPNRYVELSYAAVDVIVAIAPAPAQLLLAP